MEGALGERGHPGAGRNADGVSGHRHGNGREQQRDAHPGAVVGKIGEDHGGETQWDEIAQSVACLHHRDPVSAHLEHITLAHHAHAGSPEECRRLPCRQQLQWERDLVINDGQLGQHEQRKQDGEEPRAGAGEASEADHHAQRGAEKADRPGEEADPDRTHQLERRSGGDPGETPEAGRGGDLAPPIALSPDNPENHQRDQEAVAHIFVVPPLVGHAAKHSGITHQQGQGGQHHGCREFAIHVESPV